MAALLSDELFILRAIVFGRGRPQKRGGPLVAKGRRNSPVFGSPGSEAGGVLVGVESIRRVLP